MAERVFFTRPFSDETTLSDVGEEFAIALRDDANGWVLGPGPFATRAAAEAELPEGGDAVVLVRETMPWRQVHDYEPQKLYDGSMDALVSEIVNEELESIRNSLERGATIAVTGWGKPGKRVGHRLGCASLDKSFDRDAAWTPFFRERLLTDRDFRVGMPHLQTRDEARRVSRISSCSVCKPQLFDEPIQTRSLRAENMRTIHVGLTLSDELGTDRGTILSIDLHKDAQSKMRWDVDQVTVTTDSGVVEFAGKDMVHVGDVPDATKMAERELRLRALVGAPATA